MLEMRVHYEREGIKSAKAPRHRRGSGCRAVGAQRDLEPTREPRTDGARGGWVGGQARQSALVARFVDCKPGGSGVGSASCQSCKLGADRRSRPAVAIELGTTLDLIIRKYSSLYLLLTINREIITAIL